jgi:hypothetical protein
MGCVNPDGTLTASAQAILAALRTAGTAEQIAPLAGLPIFRVRSALRELIAAGLVGVIDGQHRLTGTGEERLRALPLGM